LTSETIKSSLASDLYYVLPQDTKLLSLQISRNVANINFSKEFLKLTPDEQMIARVALSCTLYDLEQVEYINIFVEGILMGYEGKPLGMISYRRYSSDLNALLARMQMEPEQQVNNAQSYSAALYFMDSTSQYILPEVRKISLDKEDMITSIIDELHKGPLASDTLVPVLDQNMELAEKPSIIVNITGKKTVMLNFTNLPDYSKTGPSTTALRFGALVYSIMSFVPDVENVVIKHNGTIVSEIPGLAGLQSGMMDMSDFSQSLGNSIMIYLRKQSRTQLIPVYRSVQQALTHDATSRILEIMRGPLSKESTDVWPVFPSGITQQDLLGVKIKGEIAYVNFSENFYEKCDGLMQQNESILTYAIVNTLTQLLGVKRVQFLSDGKLRDLLSHTIYIRSPLISNPGLVEAG